MTTVLDHISDVAGPLGLTVRKAIPRGPDHLLLVFEEERGSKVAGQWYADRGRARVVARETRACTGDSIDVRVLADSGVLLQPRGADRRMPVLYRLLRRPGSVLVSHRPERRAVVRTEHPGEQTLYTKVFRPDRVASMVLRSDVDVVDLAVPQLTAADLAAGTMTCTALPGRTLQALLDDAAVPDTEVAVIGRSVGAAVARLHSTCPPALTAWHDAAAEAGVTRRWLQRAGMYGLLDESRPPIRDALEHARRLLAEPPCGPTYVHRDLHDLQIVVDDKGGIGLLDFDLASVAEPALDLANLLVHLELHARHHGWALERAAACAHALVEGYGPDTAVWRRVPAYALATRLRLAAVNAFRPRRTATALGLLTDPPPGPLRDTEESA